MGLDGEPTGFPVSLCGMHRPATVPRAVCRTHRDTVPAPVAPVPKAVASDAAAEPRIGGKEKEAAGAREKRKATRVAADHAIHRYSPTRRVPPNFIEFRPKHLKFVIVPKFG